MRIRPKIYLAGPEVFHADAGDIGRRKKDLCAGCGFEGLDPADAEIGPLGEGCDRLIYRANMRMIGEADCGIFNLTPFRGPSADVGTAFELGVLFALGKPCFAYSNDSEPLLARLRREQCVAFDATKSRWVDAHGMAIEDFGNVDNLMLEACLAEQGYPIVRWQCRSKQRFTDLGGFQACLDLAVRHFSATLVAETVTADVDASI